METNQNNESEKPIIEEDWGWPVRLVVFFLTWEDRYTIIKVDKKALPKGSTIAVGIYKTANIYIYKKINVLRLAKVGGLYEIIQNKNAVCSWSDRPLMRQPSSIYKSCLYIYIYKLPGC